MEILNKQISNKLLIVITGIALPVICFLFILISALTKMHSKSDLVNYKNAVASVVLSDESEIIGKIYTENRTNIEFESIPPHLIEALLATEDIRFYKHKGIDKRSLFRVFFKTILLNRKSAGGGSTISQQLIKNLFGRNIKGPFALITVKVREFFMARRIEKVYTKDEILTLYLNTVPFGENVFGIDAAAHRYFNKKAEALSIEESAVLVGMLKANNLYNPRLNPENSKRRRNLVLNQMAKYKFLTADEADSISKIPLRINYSNLESKGYADYFIYLVKKEAERILNFVDSVSGVKYNLEEDGLIIQTTMDLDLQKAANKAFRKHLTVMQKKLEVQYKTRSARKVIDNMVKAELKQQNLLEQADEIKIRHVFTWNGLHSDSLSISDSIRHNLLLLHAGLVALDPKSGAIKAWSGGIDFKMQPYDQVLARRQTGSTFKPFLYAAALEKGFSPCDYLDNDSLTINGYDDWKPQNFDMTYGGKYSFAGSLIKSMNIPTLNLFLQLGFGSIDSLWKKLGFSFPIKNTPALAMGTAEANALEVAVAYAAFANGGYRVTPFMIESISNHNGKMVWKRSKPYTSPRVLSERTCRIINTILARAVNEGTGYPLRSVYGINIPVAGKTGTTQEYSDAWFASFNPGIVMISRVGASKPSIHFNTSANGTGSALALPLAGYTYQAIQNNRKMQRKYIVPFDQLPLEWEFDTMCPDYKEEDILDNIRDIFRREKIMYDTLNNKPAKQRRSIFRRIFGL